MLIFVNVKLFSIKIGQVLEFRGLATVTDTFILNLDREPMLGTDAFMSDMSGLVVMLYDWLPCY